MPLKTHIDEQPALNLTPMIDVTFLIMIFFLVGTQFRQDERQIDLTLPQVAEAANPKSAAPERRIINVNRSGSFSYEGNEITLDQLRERLTAARQEYEDLGVIVRGDAHGEFQFVASAVSAAQQAGISDMGIAVRLLEETP